ncbi:MAG: hypothetical protein PHS92_03900 [Candidatus Gracilibacteria bacterium]|nr:hypothetical protein [Candidatus Gracilibacteria bacterium]
MKQGDIYHIKDFNFEDGSSKNKYAIILSKTDCFLDILFTLTTSLVDKNSSKLKETDYVIIRSGTGCFKLDTMILINKIRRFQRDEFLKLDIEYKCELDPDYLIEIKRKIISSANVKDFIKKFII